MKSPSGHTGLVPLNYINVPMATASPTHTTGTVSSTSATTTTASNTTGSHDNNSPHPQESENHEVCMYVYMCVCML